MGGVLVYKCRKCGGLSKNMHVPEVSTVLVCLINDIPVPAHWGGRELISETIIHYCNGGEIGIADIIGGEIDA